MHEVALWGMPIPKDKEQWQQWLSVSTLQQVLHNSGRGMLDRNDTSCTATRKDRFDPTSIAQVQPAHPVRPSKRFLHNSQATALQARQARGYCLIRIGIRSRRERSPTSKHPWRQLGSLSGVRPQNPLNPKHLEGSVSST